MDPLDALARLETAPIGRLATVRPDGTPHLVPITFALVHGCVVHMIDHKPKTTKRLQRLANIQARPKASVLVDHYEDDWTHLWWIRVDGAARVVDEGEEWLSARTGLAEKYEQYRDRPPEGPAVYVSIENVKFWESTD